eukprot:11084-Heterococcus_DN1.PRE.2
MLRFKWSWCLPAALCCATSCTRSGANTCECCYDHTSTHCCYVSTPLLRLAGPSPVSRHPAQSAVWSV